MAVFSVLPFRKPTMPERQRYEDQEVMTIHLLGSQVPRTPSLRGRLLSEHVIARAIARGNLPSTATGDCVVVALLAMTGSRHCSFPPVGEWIPGGDYRLPRGISKTARTIPSA
jgi:hypothetical protein